MRKAIRVQTITPTRREKCHGAQDHKIALVTDDIEEAVRFYTQTLGLTVMERFSNGDGEDYVFLDAGGIILELMPQGSTETALGFHHISFEVDNVDESVQSLRDKDVPIVKEPFDVGSGIRIGLFEGPNGINLQLYRRDL